MDSTEAIEGMWHVDEGRPWLVKDINGRQIANCEFVNSVTGTTLEDEVNARKIVMAVNAPAFVHWWANRMFPDRTPKDVMIKLFEEIGEYVRSPASAGELADILILVYDLALMHGIDVHKAVYDKMMINQKRKWNFNKSTGVAQHED